MRITDRQGQPVPQAGGVLCWFSLETQERSRETGGRKVMVMGLQGLRSPQM